MPEITWDDFAKIELRVGTIRQAELFKEARQPAYRLLIDFGEHGTRKTSAQLTQLYEAQELVGRQVVAVLNSPPKQIATMQSECLVLGAVDGGAVTLLAPERPVADGLRVG